MYHRQNDLLHYQNFRSIISIFIAGQLKLHGVYCSFFLKISQTNVFHLRACVPFQPLHSTLVGSAKNIQNATISKRLSALKKRKTKISIIFWPNGVIFYCWHRITTSSLLFFFTSETEELCLSDKINTITSLK